MPTGPDASRQLGRLRLVVTPDDEPPDAAAWEAGEDVATVTAAGERMRELAGLAAAAGDLAFVWVGFDGVTVSGSRHAERRFRVLQAMKPAGWPDPERERQEAAVRAWEAHKLAVEESAKLAKAAAAVARRATFSPTRGTSMDAIR